MEPREDAQSTEIHLQDYNRSVLELVTLPNIILAWCASITAQSRALILLTLSPWPLRYVARLVHLPRIAPYHL
jgi:hypothetical protein